MCPPGDGYYTDHMFCDFPKMQIHIRKFFMFIKKSVIFAFMMYFNVFCDSNER